MSAIGVNLNEDEETLGGGDIVSFRWLMFGCRCIDEEPEKRESVLVRSLGGTGGGCDGPLLPIASRNADTVGDGCEYSDIDIEGRLWSCVLIPGDLISSRSISP